MAGSELCVVIPAYNPNSGLPLLIKGIEELSGVERPRFIVINDGSKPESNTVFQELAENNNVQILHHAINLGKGAALKTAFNHILLNEKCQAVVTADADGQHLPSDILSIGRLAISRPGDLVMGVRSFAGSVPWRSKVGNKISILATWFFLGRKVRDTQTGLRGMPKEFLSDFLTIRANGFDFEMEMLARAIKNGLNIYQQPISTVYLENNRHSNFNPWLDSLAIYFVFLRHTANSLATAAIDYLVFTLAWLLGHSLVPALIAGRLVAATFNFVIGKYFVFKSRGRTSRELVLYIIMLVVMTIMTYAAVNQLQMAGLNILLAKVLVESTIFLAIFSICRTLIFRPIPIEGQATATDWDLYYSSRSSFSPTRVITKKIIGSKFKKFAPESVPLIAELGGGASCVYKDLLDLFPGASYIIIDNSVIGINKIKGQDDSAAVRILEADLTQPLPPIEKSDIVFSLGLIEHFSPESRVDCLRAHFDLAREGGLVLITWPTPTRLYRFIRKLAEVLKMWIFHDETPLTKTEVLPLLPPQAQVQEVTKNWWAGLTQEILVAKVSSPKEPL